MESKKLSLNKKTYFEGHDFMFYIFFIVTVETFYSGQIVASRMILSGDKVPILNMLSINMVSIQWELI